jgi:pre-mRNA-splicing factor CDC5/CEF1
MRIMIKGGVWKNTEDEILKAAVMKYGMNQWARVASLLSRKSAKQCKARWYEWLDPSIKKTEWSREEEEKLLHLAKLMPSQWRTIAPIVGRTAAQCMEHYERLLDVAQQKEGVEVGDDPRRLRPGEIDPNPENKPARPDPVDMDEDEKEMLSEARARLANTKGKKAKRKAREKQLEEARRLAALQKRRELKAAGISSSQHHLKKRKFIDYAREIPFQKEAPAGFYDVSEEKHLSSKKLDPSRAILNLDKLEGKRRDDIEKKERKQDAKRQKSLMKSNLPQLIAAVNEKNDPINAIKRKPLELPAPVVSNEELTDLAKMGMHAAHAAALALESGGSATETRSLMGDYTATPLRTPSTSAAASQSRSVHDTIMQETANLAALRNQTTPLLGGENIVLHEGTGYAGATPSRMPSAAEMQSVNKTPLSSTRTPLRDELGINPDQLENGVERTSAKAERAREKRLAAELRAGFISLPAPENEYEINVPQIQEDDDTLNANMREEDAGERDAREQRVRELQLELELKRRSSAVQHSLPRPTKVKKALINGEVAAVVDEMYLMVEYDIVKHPDEENLAKKSSKKRKKSSSASAAAPHLDKISDEELQRARQMVQIEASLHDHDENVWKLTSTDHIASAWNEAQKQYLAQADEKTVSGDGIQFKFATTDEEKIRALKAEFDELKEMEQQLSKRAQKLSDRVRLVNGGLLRRADQARTLLRTQLADVENAEIEHACFENLASLEEVALQKRMAQLASEVNAQQYAEVQLQKTYAALKQSA